MTHAIIKPIIFSFKRGTSASLLRPHKPVLWLAVIDLMNKNYIRSNEIYFESELIQKFDAIFLKYKLADDLSQASQPYFHLRSSKIWHHKVKDGEQEYYDSLTTSGGGSKRIYQSITFAYLDKDVYLFLCSEDNRHLLEKETIKILRKEGRGIS